MIGMRTNVAPMNVIVSLQVDPNIGENPYRRRRLLPDRQTQSKLTEPDRAHAIGTAGYTAMLCVQALKSHGITPAKPHAGQMYVRA
jgi:hypothetical protein